MILVLRALGVGDLATAVPALRGLRAAFPDRTLVLAAPGWLAPLVDLVGGIDRLVPVEGLVPVDAANGWSVPAPFWAVNLHGRGPRSHRLLRSLRPGRLTAFRCAAAEHTDGPQWAPEEHEVRRWCRLVNWYGIPADPDDLGLRRLGPDRLPVGVTIVHPGGKDPERRWAPGRFAEVARRLSRCGHRVVITGSETERSLAERVATGAGLAGTDVLAGRLDLAAMAALVAHARLVISADTGVAHLATGYGTPSVVLFGPVRPDRWGPPPDRPWHRALWAGPDRVAPTTSPTQDGRAQDGRAKPGPAGERIHPALAAISVDQVLAAVDEVGAVGRERDAVAAQ